MYVVRGNNSARYTAIREEKVANSWRVVGGRFGKRGAHWCSHLTASDYGEPTQMITEAPSAAAARTCHHNPPCPSADASDRDAAHVLVAHPEQGWSLLCNGVVLFEDTGELLPDGQSIAARRRELLAAAAHRKS
jgi:hypothetical protein